VATFAALLVTGPISEAATAHLALEARRPLAVTAPPLDLLRIGEQTILVSPGSVAVLSADGTLQPVTGWRNQREFGAAHDAGFGYVLGGLEDSQPTAAVWRVGLDAAQLKWTRLASLPAPCRRPAATVQNGNLFVFGQAPAGTAVFLKISTASGVVENLPVPTGLRVALSLAPLGDALYLAGRDDGGTQRFWRWKLNAWTTACVPSAELLGLPPVALGPAHLLHAAANPAAPFLAYHAITDTWTTLPATAGDTIALAPRRDGVLRIVRDAAAGAVIYTETLTHPKRGLGYLDYVMLAGYFALNLGIGFWCARGKGSADDFFRDGGRLQWWALGISYMATASSSLSFMTYPSAAYASNWLLIGVPLFQSAAVIVTGLLFIGILRRLNITTVFEYLEQRFSRAIRLLGASLMVLSQVGGRLSIVMLLPAMAFSAVTGLNAYVSVLLMGVVTVIYCLKGGMKAVVWTDVLQFALMYGTVAIAVATVAGEVPGGFAGLVRVAQEAGKFEAFLFDWNFVQPTVWVFTCLAVTTVFLQLGDQSLMQRALSAPDEKAACRSVVLGGVLCLPISILLFFIGSALFVFYRQRPEVLDPLLPNDSIFPFFVGNELPRGLVGLIIAGIFAAAMSTVSGTVNAIAAVVVRDFLLPIRPASSEAVQMRLARVTTVAVGGLATATALLMARMNLQSLWETFATLMALIGGGFPGIFALGLLTRRANAPGVAIGLAASIGITVFVRYQTPTNVFLFTSVAVGSCVVVGYVASLFFPAPSRSLAGLTLSSLRPSRAAAAPPRS
jgi:SSS family transporter